MDIEQAIRDYLPQTVHMSLATVKDAIPWVCEVHFSWDAELNLYFRSLASRRHSQEIANNPNVAGNIVVQHPLGMPARGVYFEGKAHALTTEDELDKAFRSLQERFNFTADIREDAHKPEGKHFYQISVATFYLFDALESTPSQKYALPWKYE